MKKSKIASKGHRKKSARTALKAHHKQLIRKRRPIHKRILLHPVSVFIMLCVGVFLVGWTIRTFAQNLTVTASILAPLPASAANITWPANQTHFTASTATITGTCPSNTYVELYRNGSFSGLANCGNLITSYQIYIDLSLGSNQLYTRVFNITDNEGPKSAQITVWRDQPQLAPAPIPTSVPTTLTIGTLDGKSFSKGQTVYTSIYPTIRGTAIPYSYVVVTFHSTPHVCSTYADSAGNWSCTLNELLNEGLHQVNITTKSPSGVVFNYPTFQIATSKNIVPLQSPAKIAEPFTIGYTYKYTVYATDKSYTWNLSLSGGKAPYAITILWGDGSTSTVVRSNTDSFDVAHTYNLSGKSSNNYTINVKAVDSVDTVANLQLSSLVTYNGARPGTVKPNLYNSVLNFVKKWVWLIWPTYAVVLLMTTSFWLGEREEYIKIVKSSGQHRKRLVRQS